MSHAPAPAVKRLVEEIARRLQAEGAEAVALTGSHARGEAASVSDVDLLVIGSGPPYRLERHEPFLVSLSWRTAEQHRAGFANPSEACGLVPAWRQAVLVWDPAGIAAALQAEARAWSWDQPGDSACDAWAGEELTGLAEEVHKLLGSLEREQPWAAAVQRSVLALRLAGALAVHHRLLYDSENVLWDLVAARMGDPWSRLQAAALGTGGESFQESCRSALALYTLAAGTVLPLLDGRQRAVVARACALIRSALTSSPPHLFTSSSPAAALRRRRRPSFVRAAVVGKTVRATHQRGPPHRFQEVPP